LVPKVLEIQRIGLKIRMEVASKNKKQKVKVKTEGSFFEIENQRILAYIVGHLLSFDLVINPFTNNNLRVNLKIKIE
jgi:hypothetical protein